MLGVVNNLEQIGLLLIHDVNLGSQNKNIGFRVRVNEITTFVIIQTTLKSHSTLCKLIELVADGESSSP